MAKQKPTQATHPNENTQKGKILKHLRKGRTLTPMEALELCGTMRLGARVFELREMGWKIETKHKRVNKHTTVAEYKLVD